VINREGHVWVAAATTWTCTDFFAEGSSGKTDTKSIPRHVNA